MVRALGYTAGQGSGPARFFMNAEIVAPVIKTSADGPDLVSDLNTIKSSVTTQVQAVIILAALPLQYTHPSTHS